MPRLTRRSILAAGAASPLFAIRTRPARAAEFTYKYANNLTLQHPMNVRAQEAVARIRGKTGGRVEILIFPNSQFGSDTDTLSQLRAGGVEFFTLSGLILSTLVPVASINGIGFAFKDYGQVWPAMDGALGGFALLSDTQGGSRVPELGPLGSAPRSPSVASTRSRNSGTTATARSPVPPNRSAARGPERLQDPRARQPALDQHVPGVRRLAHRHQKPAFFSAARRRPDRCR
jgi:hypothetical protein